MSSSSDPLPFRSELVSALPPQDETLARRKTLIRQTWRSVEFGLGETVSRSFYDRLFERFPDVKPMFDATSMEVQAQKLYTTLRLAVRSLDDLETLRPALQYLGRRHAQSYGVVRAHYGAVTQVFLEILHEYISSHWTNNASMIMIHSRYMVDVADAWSWALNLLGGIMADAAEAAETT